MKRLARVLRPALAALTGSSLMWQGTVSGAVTYHTVALTGQQAPGTPNGAVFGFDGPLSTFGAPLLNNAGQVAFTASLLEGAGGVTNTNRLGLWLGGAGSLGMVARTGDQAPGTPIGAVYSAFPTLNLNDAGQMAFAALLQTGSGSVDQDNDEGIWSNGSGSLQMIARSGNQAQGLPSGVVYESFFPGLGLSLNNAGQVAFKTILRPFQNGGVTFDNWEGLWSEGSGNLELVARQGDQAPGMPPGVTFSELGGFRLNDSGQIVLNNDLDTGGEFNTGVWLLGPGGTGLISLRSDPVPGEPASTTYWNLSGSFDDAGQLVQTATVLRDVDGTSQVDWSIWHVTPSGLAPLVQDGTPAPGLPTGTMFDNSVGSINKFRLRDPNLVAFETTYSPALIGSNKGIWAGDPADLSLIALGAEHAPGTPNNAIFLSFDSLSLNQGGQVAFSATLALFRGGVTSTNNEGIWATDPQGQLTLIVREGELFEVAPGDLRMVDAIGGGPINDAGTLALSLHFSDGTSGIFTATVPEPGALTLIVLGFPALLRRRGV
jgi:hypothetical protein